MALFGRRSEAFQRQTELTPPLRIVPRPIAPPPEEPARPAVPTRAASYTPPPEFGRIVEQVQQHLVSDSTPVNELGDREAVKRHFQPLLAEALSETDMVIGRAERDRMLDFVIADTIGYGPIQTLLADDGISEIMVNGPDQVYIERDGRIALTDVRFSDDEHVLRVIERIVTPLGRRIDQSSPMVDARLPDGSRVNAIIPPLALVGPTVTIRKFRADPLRIEDLVESGSITAQFAAFLEAAVRARLNIIVSGGTGAGKTTLLNVVSDLIPETERIVTIEDAAELQLRQPHVVRLESRPANVEGKGAVHIRDLFVNSLRMRPDRIIVGECRGPEALDMLQAMNTGHDGSVTTIHSNSPRDTLSRIETMVMMAGMALTLRAIRQQIASAVDLVVHISRLRDGSRRVVSCAEVIGMEGDMLVLQDVFNFDGGELDENGRVQGSLRPTGIRPKVSEMIEAAGIRLSPDIFGH